MIKVIDILVTVRIPSSFLKPAALLLLGASAVFGCSVANALTFNWSITSFGGGTFDATNTVGNTYQVNGITGTWNGNSITGLNTYQGADNVFIYAGDGPLNVSSDGISFATSAGSYNIFKSSSVPATFSEVNRVVDTITGLTVIPASSSSITAVPAPLPILGLPAVLFYSRKLKKRIKASRENSSNALV